MSPPGESTDLLIAPAIRIDQGEGLTEALRYLREFDPSIFLIFGGDAEDVAWMHETLEEQAGHSILFAADLERGAGQQFDGLTPLPDAWALGLLGPEAAFEAGHRTATEATKARVRWAFAPVLDLHNHDPSAVSSPIIGHRSFGSEVQRVVEVAGAWAAGLREGGAISCAKHFPGHGAVKQDSHIEHAVSFEDIQSHLEPFRLLADQVPSMMVGHLEFPAVDPEGRPATRSPVILDILRKNWNYDGVLVSDAIRMTGFGDEPSEVLAAESLAAGIDLLLDPADPVVLAVSLRDAVNRGELDPARVREATTRVRGLIDHALGLPEIQPRPLMLGGGARRLLRPLPGGAPGRSRHPRPDVALVMAGAPDSLRFLDEWGVELLGPNEDPPDPMPNAVLVLWAAAMGRGLPSLPTAWADALHRQKPVLYISGSPDAIELAPSTAMGYYLPGVSPALLALLFATDED